MFGRKIFKKGRFMGSQVVQLIVLAGVALFLVLRLRSALGTRDGFEEKPDILPTTPSRKFDVIDGGGIDHDIADYTDPDSETGKALAAIKRVEPGFSVNDFMRGARQAYEMILMAFENGDLDFLKQYLAPDVYESFAAVIKERADKGYTVEANFGGVSELKLREARFDEENKEAEITVKFVGELTSVVRDADGNIVEGDPHTIARQTDIWTFARLVGGDNPNWLLVGTGA